MTKHNPFDKQPFKQKAVGLSLTADQHETVTELAKKLNTTRSGVFKLAMADFVDKQNRKVQENGDLGQDDD